MKMPLCIVGAVASFLGAVALNQIEADLVWIFGLMGFGAVLSIMAARAD